MPEHLYIDDTGAPHVIGGSTFPNNDYSTTETFTGGFWADGRPIYRRVFTGTITAAAGAQHNISGTFDVSRIIRSGGMLALPTGEYVTLYIHDPDRALNGVFLASRNTGQLVFQSICAEARTDAPYEIWIEYTKL
jgi:hypothetical protein